MMNKRIEYIDLAKGICIMMVVYLHCTSDGGGFPFLESKLCTFRMPLYFILSGLFFKEYGGFGYFLIKKVNKLLIPFLTFYFLIGIVMSYLYNLFFQNETHYLSLKYIFSFYYEHFNNMPNAIWFLLCLFEVNLLFYLLFMLSKVVNYSDVLLCIMSLLIGIGGYLMGVYNVNLPIWIDTSFSVVPFFCFGYILKQKTKFLYPNITDIYNIGLLFLCLVIVFILGDTVSYTDNYFSISFPSVYICGVLGSVAVLIFSKRIIHVFIISYIGRYSIIVLIVHHPIVKLFNDFLFWRTSWLYNYTFFKFSIVLLVSIGLVPIMKRYAPYVTAQRELIKI